MKAGGGKQKGAQFERDVCVMLSKWVSEGKQEDVFWRSAMSGGRATVGHKTGKKLSSQVGDISCVHPLGMHFISKFAPECKFYADLEWRGLPLAKGKLAQFWLEICVQADIHGKLPFLVARQNRMPAYVCLNSSGMMLLDLAEHNTVLTSFPVDIFILEADDFFKVCKPYVASVRRSSPNRQRKRLASV